MKKLYLIRICLSALVVLAAGNFSAAQCPVGATTASLNWDNRDYLSQGGTYAAFVTPAMMQTQKFTLGVTGLTINIPAAITTAGENTLNTAEPGSFGAGADVQYGGNGIITITFDTVVNNVQFSLYDIDALQTARVTATGPGALALNVSMTAVTAGTLTITGSGGTTPLATANATAIANTDTRATVNITIAGNSPAGATGVKTITITTAGTSGDFWLSDMSACVFRSFPLNYYATQKPWTGQPSYYLVTPDNNSVYMMNPLTGVAQWMFSEPVSPWVNSMAYDGVNRILYYVMDNPTANVNNRSLKKYDFNTESVSTVIADLRTLGMPLFDLAVESAGAAFYNGSLYLGVEGTNSSKTSNRESIIWRIDFNSSLVPVTAYQVFAFPADNGSGLLTHDWGDFTIKDGMLYDFNTGNVGSTSMYVHYNMQTGVNTNFSTGTTPAPIQAGQIWDGTIYWTGGQAPETGRIAKYNEDGTIGAKIVATVTICSPAWAGRAGDASDPFKPKSDFGDAPDTYDPVFDDKATHEYDCNLRLGATFDREWDKTPSPTATADGTDEDGISTITVLTSGTATFVQDVQVYNNTGATATLIGWLDYNGNGIYDPVEGKSITVPTNAAMQTISLSWIGIPVSMSPGSFTFLRLRLTSASNGMTLSKANGWYSNGEVEDYRIPVDFVLPVKMLSFTAVPSGAEKVECGWITGQEVNFKGFDVLRSADGIHWNNIGYVAAHADHSALNQYTWYDNEPLMGRGYYRLQLQYVDERPEFSETKIVERKPSDTWMKLIPNPVKDKGMLQFYLDKSQTVTIRVFNTGGQQIINKSMPAQKGMNSTLMNDWKQVSAGVYIVQVITGDGILSSRVVVE